MSQYDFGTIDPDQTDGIELAGLLENFRDALNSMHSGAIAPTYGVKGMLWLDTSTAPHPINICDGSEWILIGDINPATNIYRPNLAGIGLGALAYKSVILPSDLDPGFVLSVNKGGTGANTATGARNALGLAIGTNVQGFHANLAAEAGLVGAADKLAYYTGAGAKSLTDLSPFARSLLDDENAETARETLGVGLGGGNLLSVSYFKTSGIWTKSTHNPSFIIVMVIGGGGAGGGTGDGYIFFTGGGAAGGHSRKTIPASALAATETVTIGAGGAGILNAAGGIGGTSSFGSHCSATGGIGGYKHGTNANKPDGGIGSSGDLNGRGGAGEKHDTDKTGNGGASVLSGGAPGRTTPGAGNAGLPNTGEGGSGAHNGEDSGFKAGGPGGSGLIIVWEFS